MAETVRSQLVQLRDVTNADSLAEVIRRALAVYDLLRKATADGSKIMIQNGDVQREVVITEFAKMDE